MSNDWEQRYALEMIERGAELLGGQIELVQDMTLERIKTLRIVIHLESDETR